MSINSTDYFCVYVCIIFYILGKIKWNKILKYWIKI